MDDPSEGVVSEGGSNSLRWWTRSQRIRTAARIPVEVALLSPEEPPLYQRIAQKALQLQELGLNGSSIARRLGVDHKTVGKGIAWLRRIEPETIRSDGS